MSRKFHVTKSGRTEPCTATVKSCPLGEANHFGSPAEAINAALAADLAPTYSEKEVWRAEDVAVEYGLLDERSATPERLQAVAESARVSPELLTQRVEAMKRKAQKERDAFDEQYRARVREVIEQTPAALRKGAVVAVKDGNAARLMKIDSVRGGNLFGRSVEDGEHYEPVYFDGTPIDQVMTSTEEL